ncbi:MAG TPA: cyclic pyranopterin monophosphate synthase MoaC [Acidimicrobiales bacterium]|jgi:cyclic pyranopterin phosphate synthase|nr:cyclic pyranopterin monophosphate synthase MoaC [Acidimicrobiales bacterium]
MTDAGSGLTHIDRHGRARMVDVTAKAVTRRVAMAKCIVVTTADIAQVRADAPDGIDIVEAARIAGIQGAKLTSSLIPLCHPIRLDGVAVEVVVGPRRFEVSAVTEITERTGVEMEALTACALAALTLVEAVRHLDPDASMEELTLWHKSGGRSGDWQRHGPGRQLTQDTPTRT